LETSLETNKIFPFNERIQNQLKEIRKTIRLSMNGVASDAMRHLGYEQNYGVALPRIKEIAGRYAKDALLAGALWNSGIREMMIMATLLQPEDLISEDEAFTWISGCRNLELVEQCCRNLWVAVPYSNRLAQLMLMEDNNYKRATAYITYSLLLADGLAEEDALGLFLASAEADILHESPAVYTSVSRFLKQAGKKDQTAVAGLLDKYAGKTNGAAWVAEEVKTFLFEEI
jgi:3-methyladenine DNA glycosylase AlkD